MRQRRLEPPADPGRNVPPPPQAPPVPMTHGTRPWILLLFALAGLAWLGGCSSTAPDKRLLQYLNDKGFGKRYTGNAEDQNYVTIGDTVSITDAFHLELTVAQPVDIDGTIILPEIGAVHVAGQTRSELEAFLTQKYSPYYEQLKIDVRISTRNKLYFVFGEVLAKGEKQFSGNLTVFEAVMSANPDERTANLARTQVIRADPRDPLVIPVNISALFRGDSTDNIQIQELDIIYVPPTMIAQFGYFLSDLIFPITSVLRQLSSAIWFFYPGFGVGGAGRGRYYDQGGIF
jgi:protein involved in polysaccharide export with SLBB domain